MRIAFITPEYVTETSFDGGLANYIRRISHALQELGHEPTVLVASNKDEAFDHEGIPVIRVNLHNRATDLIGLFRKAGFFQPLAWALQSWKLNKALQRLHRKKRIDIAQFASYMATALFRPRDIPSVVRLSSFQPLWFEAYEHSLTIPNRLLQYLETAALKRADRLIGPGKAVAVAAERVTGKKVYLIESPYIKSFGPPDMQPYVDMLKGKKYLLFFGTVGILKGVKAIADIIFPLLEKHDGLFFVFAGKDVGCKTGLMMDHVRAQSGPHSGRIIYLGPLPHQQLYPVIEHAYAVVLPSRVDNFPNTCLEAMASGKIVIGTRGTSFEQLIDDGENGLLCEVDNGQSLLLAIEKALSLPEDRKLQMVDSARQRIAMLRPERVVHKLIEIYQEIL